MIKEQLEKLVAIQGNIGYVHGIGISIMEINDNDDVKKLLAEMLDAVQLIDDDIKTAIGIQVESR